MDLTNHQWELLSLAGESAFVFGTTDTGVQFITAPDYGTREVREVDREAPREDGERFGADYEEGTTLTFEANVLSTSWAEQADLLNRWRAAWSKREFRRDSNAYAMLRTMQAGRVRRCYGRPRRFSETDGALTHEGYTAALADFRTVDGKFYDDAEQVVQVNANEQSTPALTSPIITTGTTFATLASVPAESLPGGVLVDGVPTWAQVEIHGPVAQPRVLLGDVSIGLNYTIPAGERVVLDPRPWNRRIYRGSDGANLAGVLTHDTPPMAEWLLEPGAYALTFAGTNASGSYVLVRYRNAFLRP